MKDDITQIENFLKGLDKPVLSSKAKYSIRDGLVKNIRAEKKLEQFVRNSGRDVELSSVSKALLKEKLMAYVSSGKSFMWGQFLSYSKRLVGALTLATFLFGTFGFSVVSVKVASADSFTYLEDVAGGAKIYRSGEVLDAYQNMVLENGDKVVTDADSFVSIKFLDKNIARLGGGTTVYLDGVGGGERAVNTDVKVEVENGVLWSRVLNLVNTDSSFTVKVGDVYAYAKKAAFNVSKNDDEVQVEVYSSVVNVVGSDQTDKKIKTGQSAIVKKASENTRVNVVSRVTDDSWVEKNLDQDRIHMAKVEEESAKALKDSAGVLPENPLYGFKGLKTGVIKMFTFDDVASQKVSFESAEVKFLESTVLLKEGKVSATDAEVVFNSYVNEVNEFKELVKAVRDSGDTVYADELEVYLSQKIKERQDDFKAVLPASPMYVAKDYVFQAGVAAAASDVEKTVVKQVQATQKLVEAQDLVEAGDSELAAQVIGDYAQTVSELKKEINALPEEKKAEAASAVVTAIKDDKEMLSSIQNSSQTSLNSQDVTEVAVQVEKLVVDPIANNLEAEVSVATAVAIVSEPETVTAVVVAPVQTEGEYGVTVVGTGSTEKLLDPLLNLNK